MKCNAVSGLFWLKIKSQRYLLILLLVVVAFQIMLGQASAHVLMDRELSLNLAVQQLASDSLSDELVERLSDVDTIEVIIVDAKLSPDEVFRQENVQALLIIPVDFAALIEAQERPVVTLIPAPGVTNRDFAREQVANTVMQLRAYHNLKMALETLGAADVLDGGITTINILDVVYEGPLLQPSTSGASAVYGVSALLILLAFLHAALTVPTREDKRVAMRGRSAFIRQWLASILVVWLVWLVVIALYFGFLTVFVGVPPNPLICLAFVAILFYVSVLGALFAQLIGKHNTSWVFLPLFILSMTIGGGLWANVSLTPAISPLAPVIAVAASSSGSMLGTVVLFAAALLALAVLAVTIFRSTSHTQRHFEPKAKGLAAFLSI